MLVAEVHRDPDVLPRKPCWPEAGSALALSQNVSQKPEPAPYAAACSAYAISWPSAIIASFLLAGAASSSPLSAMPNSILTNSAPWCLARSAGTYDGLVKSDRVKVEA